MHRRLGASALVFAAAAVGLSGALASGASGPPPPPTSHTGSRAELVASGLSTPTSFAFGAGQTFVSDGGGHQGNTNTPGGVFVLKNGVGKRLAGSPPYVAGIAFHKGTLYVSAGQKILAWSGWDGSKFKTQKTIDKGPKGFTGFNGLGFGVDGRMYVGVSLGDKNDHSPSKAPFAFDILSFNAKGKGGKVVARGLRQPWQFAFPAHSSSPFVSDLGQDKGVKNPPDFVYRIHQGDDAGFPKCNWTKPKNCKGFAKPFKFFPPHASAMGLGILKGRLYISLFGGIGKTGPEVVSMSVHGGKTKPVLTGFVAPIVALATHNGFVYVGELTGQVFRVKP
jgi:glucose/arabinose dehydrogenase